MAITTSDMGYLTAEQKQTRDLHQDSMHQTLFCNYLIDQSQQEMCAIAKKRKDTKF